MNVPVSIPVWSYVSEYEALRAEILEACDRVFKSGRLIFGEEGKGLEQALAAQVGVTGGVGVNSGTDALYIALAALGVGAGDEVITVPNTAVPTVSAIVTVGARPVFVDVDCCLLLDPAKLEAAITKNTKAIVPVHLYGQCADMDAIRAVAARYGIKVLEDVAQAHGATYKSRMAGSLGDAAAFSFYPTKILGAYGDGGMILSNSAAILDLARTIRFYGIEAGYYSERHGYNSRLDELQAAILRVKLPHLARWIERRQQIAQRYDEAFRDSAVEIPRRSPHGSHVFHLYTAQHPERERIIKSLAERGVGCSVNYRWPIHLMAAYRYLGYAAGDFPAAEAAAQRVFCLPIHPHLADADVDRVIGALRELV